MLVVRNLRKSYGSRSVLNDINFSLEKGFWAIIGKNGAGKTTLLKCILGIESYEGSIKIFGKEVKLMSREEIASKVGYVPQITTFNHPFTIREFIEIGCYYRNGNINRALDILKLDGDRKVNTLSGGEFQKVLIARALAGVPKILLLDEPSNHLDIKNTMEIMNVLKKYSESNLVMAVVHDLNLLRFCDGIIAIVEGKCHVYADIQKVNFEIIFDAKVRVVHIDNQILFIPENS